MSERIVVVGASAGGVQALQRLAAQLSGDFPAPILVVQHIGAYPSILPSLLARSGPMPASHPSDRDRLEPGRIHVAPPDVHMLVDGDEIRLVRGPKENHARPAIDPLFRSAAISYGAAVIGVLLTGHLDDGTAGLQAIKRCGGTVVVQDPDDAAHASMPASALRYVEVDHRVPLEGMGRLLKSLVTEETKPVAKPAARFVHENEIMLGKGDFVEHLQAIGKPSTFVCPECDGALWQLDDTEPLRFRCHTGHAFTLRSLAHAQAGGADDALWSALRALQEKEMLLKSLAQTQRDARESGEATRLDVEAEQVARHAETLRRIIQGMPPTPE